MQVVCPGNAPPGCSFCRPQFAAAAAAGGLGQVGGSSAAPLLQLDGLWHPLLGLQSSGSVVPNDVGLGGHRPGAMLLTGKLKEQQCSFPLQVTVLVCACSGWQQLGLGLLVFW